MKRAEPTLPPAPGTTLALAGVVILWLFLRLVVWGQDLVPLSYILPLMLCIWTRRRWQLWSMAAVFLLAAVFAGFQLLPGAHGEAARPFMMGTVINVLAGAAMVHLVLRLRDKIDAQGQLLHEQKRSLEDQRNELEQQNEEMKAQTDELAQQQAEMESQAEEIERRNEDLHEANERLATREKILQAAVDCSRASNGAQAALEELCERTLAVIEAPAVALGLLEICGDHFQLRAQARRLGAPELPAEWPSSGSMAAVVLQEGRTVYVDDLAQRLDRAPPFVAPLPYRSLLGSPIQVEARRVGVMVVCATQPTHWTNEQFRVVEWAAAQTGPIFDSLRWQEELVQRTAAVEAANQAKDQFLAMLSHELRTPLTPVLAAVGALETDRRLPEDVRAELAMMQRNVAVQSRLIDDLLDLTRISRGKFEVKRQRVALEPLLREAAAIVAPDLDAKEQTLVLQLDLPGEAAVLGDGGRLQQVFWNLLKNSIKFSPRSATITLSVRGRPGRAGAPAGQRDGSTAPEVAELTFVDHGVGIANEDLQRIFLPFEQVGAAPRSRSTGGLGLGLSIARTIVELHDGVLSAESAGCGRGATFTVTLPLAPPVAGGGGVLAAPPSGTLPELTGHRILLVEDHGDTGRVIARLLRRAGHEVVHAESLAAGFAAWQQGRYDVVVSDLGLPDGSGLDLMRRIRATGSTVPGICMSGYGMEADVQASREVGYREHLTKPIDMQQLHAAIRRASRQDPVDAVGS